MTVLADIQCMALFCDFENIALGVRENQYARFEIKKILERLLLKGSIVVKKAYCDWDRYKEFKRDMHEAAFELIEIPHVRQSGKNSADIRMVVDALDLCYTKTHVDAFVIISGDSDFSPLVSKLRENNKVVIGVGVRSSTSDLLIANCDEFIFYDEFARSDEPKKKVAKKAARAPVKRAKGNAVRDKPAELPEAPESPELPEAAESPELPESPEAAEESAPSTEPIIEKTEATLDPIEPSVNDKRLLACEIVVGTLEQLLSARGEDELLAASSVKNAIKRIRPGFSEPEYGYKAFGKILEDAEKRGMLTLERRERGGMFIGLPQADVPRG